MTDLSQKIAIGIVAGLLLTRLILSLFKIIARAVVKMNKWDAYEYQYTEIRHQNHVAEGMVSHKIQGHILDGWEMVSIQCIERGLTIVYFKRRKK